jgi:CPA1 family monovalent cation:H+ antiporter
MWRSLGSSDADSGGQVGEARAVKDAMLEAAREEVLSARSQSGADPTIVDNVLRRLDLRGTQFE